MATINKNLYKLAGNYLFLEVSKILSRYTKENPGVTLLKLGIGNTTEALPPEIVKGIIDGAKKLGNVKTYTGYGDELGEMNLRTALANYYKKRGVKIFPEEVFVSDGAKTDSTQLQSLFGVDNIVAVADPVYPAYVDSNVLAGRTGKHTNSGYEKIVYMPATEKNGFIPDPPNKKVDIIYICSPNNPTGAVATKAQLKKFVDYARANKAVIFFDAAYAEYISYKSLPKSIYEVEGAKECAIEFNSFSKWAGFTGVRLGWSVIPFDFTVNGTKRGEVNELWCKRQAIMYNGASNVVQSGGLAVLSPKGQKECKKIISYYMKNAQIIKKGVESVGLKVFGGGGENAPYIWVKTPNNLSSWDFFHKLLKETHVVGTPGVGFGPRGEGYFRFSAFGHRENIEKAVASIRKNLKL